MASAFEHVLAVEMLRSQALRTLALGLLFGAAALFVALVAAVMYMQFGWGAAPRAPLTVFAAVAGITAYEFAMWRMIRAHIARNAPLPRWRWYANACIEISTMSAIMLSMQGLLSNPVYSLATPPLLAYFLFIILSTLYLDVKLSLFTGVLAAAEYLAIMAWTFMRFGTDAAHDPVFLTSGLYLGKTFVLLMAGAGAGFVARELLRRLRLSLVTCPHV
jgi:adenylate cyclase